MVTVLWHIIGEFYNVRLSVGMGTVSKKAMRMRHKIYNVEEVDWKYHVVLSYDEPSLLKDKKEGISGKTLTYFFQQLKKVCPEEMHFWKYEEGRKSERPHFHLLVDMNKMDDKLILEKVHRIKKHAFEGQKEAYEKWVKQEQQKTEKTEVEINLGILLKNMWKKGFVNVREIKSKEDLHEQVEKDVAKRTGNKEFTGKFSWGFSRGIKVNEEKKEKKYEWRGDFPLEEARIMLEETKENFIKYFDTQSYSGAIVWERTIAELKAYREEKEGKYYKQMSLPAKVNPKVKFREELAKVKSKEVLEKAEVSLTEKITELEEKLKNEEAYDTVLEYLRKRKKEIVERKDSLMEG